jgi:serine/threonine protein phosphatase PrpC
MTRVHSFSLSDKGLSERNNDALCDERIGSLRVCAVAGGREGRPAGTDAGRIAIDALRAAVKKNPDNPATALLDALVDADARIGAAGLQDRSHAGMGTHLSACIVDQDLDCTILDTGNGGVYYISPGTGIVTPGEIPFSDKGGGIRKKTMIAHTLGEPYVLRGSEITRVNLLNSFIVLGSEGFYDYVKREEIRTIVEQNDENVEAACEQLKDRALLAGSGSTISMIVLHGHSD